MHLIPKALQSGGMTCVTCWLVSAEEAPNDPEMHSCLSECFHSLGLLGGGLGKHFGALSMFSTENFINKSDCTGVLLIMMKPK